MAKGPTQGQKKLRLHFERLIETDFFKDEVARVRRALDLPFEGSFSENLPRGVEIKYREETTALRNRLPVINDYLLKQLRDYIFYNKFSGQELGDVCEIEDAETELGRYAVSEDPDSMGKNPQIHNDNIEERLERYPVSVRIHTDASQRDVVEFIRKNWSSIASSQKSFRKGRKSSLKNSKTGVAHKERDAFIYAHRDLSHKKLARLVSEQFHESIDMGSVGKIISNETKRRKV